MPLDRNVSVMNRRELLAAALTAGTAGCLVNTSDRSTPTAEGEAAGPTATPVRDDPPTATSVGDDPPTYKPAGSRSKDLEGSPFVRARIATMPTPVPFKPWIELVQQPGPNTVGKLTIGMTNRTNETWTISAGSSNPYSGGVSDAEVLVGYGPTEFEDGCPRGAMVSKGVTASDKVLPQRSNSTTYKISAKHDNDVCFPADDHRFPGYVKVFENHDSKDPTLAFEWWFTLIAE